MQQQPGDNFKALKILHFALLGGITMFTLISLLVVKKMPRLNNAETVEQVLQVITAVVSLTALLAGFNLFKKKVSAARSVTGTAEERLNLYRAGCITWWAMIEGPGILAIISFMLTGNYAFLALAVFHIIILAVFMPRKEGIILLLNLSSDEVARLEGK